MANDDDIALMLEGRSSEEIDALELMMRGVLAREYDNAVGFGHFFWCVFGKSLLKHVVEDKWIEEAYHAREIGKGEVVESFRGSAKTTVITQGLTLFRIGHSPEKANLLIQVGDDIAKDNTSQMADIIANNKGWKACFPNVVPDRERGWGDGGYEVKRADMEYGEWRKMNAGRKDPTLVGLGYSSRSIIGKRPDGVLVVDDINDENNTSSQKENENTIKIVTSTLFPAKTPDTWTVFIGTPWTNNDVLSYVKSTGEFIEVKTPILDVEGKSRWQDRFSDAAIESIKKTSGSLEFARMYLLDLTAAAGVVLKREWLHDFPVDRINNSWPVYFGVDYASTSDQLKNASRDYFTIAFGRVIPGGGIVLTDGYRERLSQGEAEEKLKALAAMYSPALIGVESIGKGEEFYGLLLRTTSLPLMPYKSSKSKALKFEKGLAPLFESSRAWVSQADTPFLKAFRDEWVSWPNGDHDDTLDAVYYMCMTAQPHLMLPVAQDGFERKKKASQEMFAFGRMR